MNVKRILLIEDCDFHAEQTKALFDDLNNMFSLNYKVFTCLLQNGQDRNMIYKQIREYIISQIESDSFDILMIDMLLGDDSAEDPLGLQIIKNLHEELKTKEIFVYTEMSSDELDVIKHYNRSIENRLKIILKPDLYVLDNMVDCLGEERKEFLKKYGIICTKTRCTYKEKFLCDMTYAYYKLEGNL